MLSSERQRQRWWCWWRKRRWKWWWWAEYRQLDTGPRRVKCPWAANATSAFSLPNILLTRTDGRRCSQKTLPGSRFWMSEDPMETLELEESLRQLRGWSRVWCSPPCEQPGLDPCYRATGLTGLLVGLFLTLYPHTPPSLPPLTLSREIHPADKPQWFHFSLLRFQYLLYHGGIVNGLEVSFAAICDWTGFFQERWPHLTHWHCLADPVAPVVGIHKFCGPWYEENTF